MVSDEEIIIQIKNGNMTAFKSLFDSVYFQLYFHCRKFVPDSEDAKDLLQNVFLRFWEKRSEIDIHTSLNAYLFRSVQNECLNYIRSNRITTTLEEGLPDNIRNDFNNNEPSPFSDLAILEIEKIVENTIDKLPDQCKSIFKLSRINGLKNQEIADKLTISVRTVDTQIYRALKILKDKLKDYMSS
ncbi:RNA polymerase sigma-70 factor [Parabacteroides provencensis]|uniref:RNA polymerase sigma-70 factor n=1 Tax=Parabacteroides provencensis TaxID=1944636 RepID=UPI000C1524D8|nr:RNA polymerase sigma-70 factor [Parabacteroides provencensis]